MVGDLAAAMDAKGVPLPGLAQVAMQGGAYAARSREQAGARYVLIVSPKAFQYSRDSSRLPHLRRAVSSLDMLVVQCF